MLEGDIEIDEMLEMVSVNKVKRFAEIGVEEFGELERILLPCLELDREKRPKSIKEIIKDSLLII